MEVRIAKKSYASIEGEDKKTFLKRVNIELEKDFDEAIDIKEVSIDSLKKLDDSMIAEAYKVSNGLQESILKAILAERGIEVEKIERVSRAKVEKIELEVAKASQDYADARANIGKLVSYIPTPKGEEKPETVKGMVKSVSFNKTNTILYYNIQAGAKLRCTTTKNTTLEFFEF